MFLSLIIMSSSRVSTQMIGKEERRKERARTQKDVVLVFVLLSSNFRSSSNSTNRSFHLPPPKKDKERQEGRHGGMEMWRERERERELQTLRDKNKPQRNQGKATAKKKTLEEKSKGIHLFSSLSSDLFFWFCFVLKTLQELWHTDAKLCWCNSPVCRCLEIKEKH